MDISVIDFMEFFIDKESQHIQIWSNDREKVVFDGYYNDIPESLQNTDVTSIDNVYSDNKGIFVLNVDEWLDDES
jgi:hypothetical protein